MKEWEPFDIDPTLKRRLSLRDRIAEVMRTQIFTGRWTVDQELTESGLAEDLEASRTPIREALIILLSEGLVRKKRNGRYRIVSVKSQLQELIGVRAALETYAVRGAVTSLTMETVNELESTLAKMERLDPADYKGRISLNRTLHLCFLKTTQNKILINTVERYQAYFYQLQKEMTLEQIEMEFQEHSSIVRAALVRDRALASSLMYAHIMRARDYLG